MRKTIVATIVLLTAIMVMAGCETQQKVSAASRPEMSNSDLETSIKAKLDADPQLREADLGVNAYVDENKIELSGTVPAESLRERAVHLTKEAWPGFIVNDKIDVKMPEPDESNTPG